MQRLAALLVGGGFSLAVIAVLTRVRNKQRSLAAILDDTMGEAPIPVEVVSEAPRARDIGTYRSSGCDVWAHRYKGHAWKSASNEPAIPFRAGEYLVVTVTFTLVVALAGAYCRLVPHWPGSAGGVLSAVDCLEAPVDQDQAASQEAAATAARTHSR